MGITSLVKLANNYARTSNFKSLLTKPMNFKTIKIKEIGYIWQDGKISFASPNVVEKYAKNRAVLALQGSKPYERGILYKDNYVIKEINGNRGSVDLQEIDTGSILAHGHPRETVKFDSPVSIQDFICFKVNKLKKMIAYNKVGESSQFVEIPQRHYFLNLLPKKWKDKIIQLTDLGELSELVSSYAKKMSELYPKNYQKSIEAFTHKLIGKPYASHSQIETAKKIQINEIALRELLSFDNKLIQDGVFYKEIHNFWKQNAKQLGCIYETNFSCLKK